MATEKPAIPSALAGEIQKTVLGKLHHVETEEKQVLPDQECKYIKIFYRYLMARTHQSGLSRDPCHFHRHVFMVIECL
jgi:hypothetical protein